MSSQRTRSAAPGMLRAMMALALFPALALATPRETQVFTNVISNGLLNSSANTVVTRTLAGGYTLGRLDLSGTLTSLTANTWLIDSRLLVTAPNGATIVFQPFTSGTTYTSQPFGRSLFFAGVTSTTGQWTFRFFELVDNGGVAVPDARWNLTIVFTDDPPVPPASTDLGTLSPPGVTLSAVPLAASQIRWYRFTLAGPIRPSLGTFLDVDTIGSIFGSGADATNDTEVALYNSTGVLIATDDDSGPSLSSQLTFGSAGRPASGDGLPYDGRDGSLPAGQYYLAVGAYDMVVGPLYWSVSSTSSLSGTINLHLGTGQVPCPADWNGSGVLNSQDFFDFLNAFFAGSADYNGDSLTNSQDFFDFLNAFFAGC